MIRSAGSVQSSTRIQRRKRDRADYAVPNRQQELDHTHQDPIFPERSIDHGVGVNHLSRVWNLLRNVRYYGGSTLSESVLETVPPAQRTFTPERGGNIHTKTNYLTINTHFVERQEGFITIIYRNNCPQVVGDIPKRIFHTRLSLKTHTHIIPIQHSARLL